MTALVSIKAVARLELAELLRSRWITFLAVLYAVLGLLFILVGLRESEVMGFSGIGHVLMSLCNVLVILLPILALTGTAQTINRARSEGALELLFSHPLGRKEYFDAVTLVRYFALLLPLIGLFILLSLGGMLLFGEAASALFMIRAMGISASLLWAFTGLGFAISVWIHNPARAMVWLLVIWVMGIAFLDFGIIGMMLAWRLPPILSFGLACFNPVEASRVALLSAAEPTLSTLGPVGFFLANRLGSTWLLVLGILWPMVFGTLAWFFARRRFLRSDLL